MDDGTITESATASVDDRLPEERKHWAYVLALLLVVGGFGVSLIPYSRAGDIGYLMSEMHGPMPLMHVAMWVMVAGLVVAVWALFPSIRQIRRRKTPDLVVTADDSKTMTFGHWLIVVGMAVAVTIDFMKPITLGFVLPGYTSEYGLSTATAAYLALFGIGGTAVGSVFWGWMADRVGRRAVLLFTSLVFLFTSACGAMVPWQMNVAMCAVMGLASGGLLPVALAFLAEILPTRHRSWIMVIIGGELALAYAASSWLATWLVPEYTWRMLWFVGAPLALFLIVLSYVIPESPRFLLSVSQVRRAMLVMRRHGMEAKDNMGHVESETSSAATATLSALGSRVFIGRTSALALIGLSAGLINYGFILWLPVNLQKIGVDVASTNALLAQASLVSLPAILIVAMLYSKWSSKKTVIVGCGVTIVALGALVIVVPTEAWVLQSLVILVLSGNGALYAALGPYAAEMYPTYLRSGGTGVAEAWGRVGGVLGPGIIVASLAPPGLVSTAVIALVPTVAAAVGIVRLTRETRGKSLDELGAA